MIVSGARPKLNWKADLASLDMHHYLPLFVSGLREEEEPYRFLAEEGSLNLVAAAGEARVLPIVAQLVIPLKDALVTRDEKVIVRTLRVLSEIAALGPLVGAALVPFYRQLLPVLNIFLGRDANLGDGIDYGQRFGRMSDKIVSCLNTLEMNGGPDALVNIKYVLPLYESTLAFA